MFLLHTFIGDQNKNSSFSSNVIAKAVFNEKLIDGIETLESTIEERYKLKHRANKIKMLELYELKQMFKDLLWQKRKEKIDKEKAAE